MDKKCEWERPPKRKIQIVNSTCVVVLASSVCDTCKGKDIEGWKNPCIGCTEFEFYEPKDELLTERECE